MSTPFIAKSLERQHLKSARKYPLLISDINIELNKIHQQITDQIEHSKYEAATAFIDQYIAHTSIWQLKFVCNFENPEVVLMQIFHLDYIFNNEPSDHFSTERELLNVQWEKFLNVTLYTEEKIEHRKQKMLHYIQNY
ncbi:hypothetical protein CSE16_01610 [Solibacillus sp. R5-41]|uniref:hypothetical protein n=1 Tax=Solibacillus sp. R5-41 TaxID=2048654 RepID=UPI000C128A67|nr:hypothetical protein [Solibacillus sp. R5-41]ATP38813.1 hypothetical protein CSE16_01610 [Solibacillus sp. R5-41]